MYLKGFGMSERLNLGAGLTWPSGWDNVDKYPASNNIIEADVLEGLPFPDNHFDFVLMNHVLQTFTYNEHESVFKEVRRVMKKGATLRILVPDLERAVGMYEIQNDAHFPISDKLESTIDGKFARYLFWHGETRCAFTDLSLRDLLIRNGFKRIHNAEFGECELDSREEESLIMEAIKWLV